VIFKLKIKKRALKFIEKLSKKEKQQLKALFEKLKSEPIPYRDYDVVKLRGLQNHFRIRIGTLRIVYEVLWEEKQIIIHFVGPRGKAYK